MNILAKQIKLSNIACTFKEGTALPEPSSIFACYSSADAKGSLFSDSPATGARVFELPARGFQWVFEPSRVRLEDKKNRLPEESKLAAEFLTVVAKLYPSSAISAYGFNFDITYRMAAMIPNKRVMGHFLKPEVVENVKGFGWQYSLEEKGKRLETYFLKAISPIEYGAHVNFHFNEMVLPAAKRLQEEFERSYQEADAAIEHIS